MKRPEGFDRPRPEQEGRPGKAARPPRAEKGRRPADPVKKVAPVQKTPPVMPPPSVRSDEASTAERDLKRAARERRRYEREEVKRFTRRSRRRRLTWFIGAVTLLVVVGAVTGAVYSPLLALTTIRVEGNSAVSSAQIRSAVAGQIGRPLATLDTASIKRELSRFPLIRSFVTEAVPPHTLVIKVSERTPIGTLSTASGFSVIDAAGVVLDRVKDRPAGLPIVDVKSATTTNQAFSASVSVLLSVPAELLKKIDTVSASTPDDVTLTLTGAGQTVVWGSAEDSALKARVLVALIATQDPNAAVKYDVSAPSRPVVGSG